MPNIPRDRSTDPEPPPAFEPVEFRDSWPFYLVVLVATVALTVCSVASGPWRKGWTATRWPASAVRLSSRPVEAPAKLRASRSGSPVDQEAGRSRARPWLLIEISPSR